MSATESNNWYLLFTAFRAESRVKTQLDAAGVTNYLPVKSVRMLWQNVEKVNRVSALSRCIFVSLPKEELEKLAAVSLLLLPIDFSDCCLSAQEMENVRILFRDGNAPVEWIPADEYAPGAMVKVVGGDFQGLMGELLQVADGYRVLVRVSKIVNLATTVTLDQLERV